MCKVVVTCNCKGGGGDFGAMVGLVAVAVAAVSVVPIVIGFLTSLVVALVTVAGIAVGGWVLKGVLTTAVEEVSLHLHNRRMARIYPHVAQQLGYDFHQQQRPALPEAPPPRRKAEILEARVIRRGE
jgi:hypothetical protein